MSFTKLQSEKAERPIAYALFAGAGGFHLGLEMAGFNIILATDIDPYAEQTHRVNWPNVPFLCEDIRTITADRMITIAGGRKPFLIFGGPPCQGFSTLGDKLSSDPRNQLFAAFARLVGELMPKAVLIENIQAFVTMYNGKYADYVLRKLEDLGYTMYQAILNAADYGVPQIRHRVFFLGTRVKNPFTFPRPVYGPIGGTPYETVGKWIMDLANKGPEVPNHIPLRHSNKVVSRYRLVPEGGKLPPLDKLPKEIRRKNFGNTYKRLSRDRPSLTLVPGNNAFPVHPTLNRSLTPREAARLQTFPDSFIFKGTRRKQCILVGNAVPPKLAEAIGNSIIDHYLGITSANDTEKYLVPKLNDSTYSKMENYLSLKKLQELNNEDGFIDLFSGGGGFIIGFSLAGWKPVLAADFDPSVAAAHRFNFPNIPLLEEDLSKPTVRDRLVKQIGRKKIGIIVGGPPCQGFSIFGKRRFIHTKGYDPSKDTRNRLVFVFIDLVETIHPRWFVMENVPGFVSLDGGKFFVEVIRRFRSIGYHVEAKVLNAAKYGIPQLRKRLLIIGNCTGHIIPWPKQKYFKEPREWQKPFRKVGEVLTDLADPNSYGKMTCHVPMKHKPFVIKRYQYIPEGGVLNVKDLPDYLKKGYRTKRIKNYSHVYKRLHRERPSITMVPGHNAFPIHPWLDRALTVREAARIQAFPDEMEFKGTRQEQCIQVGNAFPPLLAELVANNIRKAEINKWFPDNVPALAYYSLIEREGNGDQIASLMEVQASES